MNNLTKMLAEDACFSSIACAWAIHEHMGEFAGLTTAYDWLLEDETNPDGLPIGLTVSDDGERLNWRGETYARMHSTESAVLEPDAIRNELQDNGLLMQDEHDTREKLEHDITMSYTMIGFGPNMDDVVGWLDRQAAITARECEERIDELELKYMEAGHIIERLTAERDNLKAQLDELERDKEHLELDKLSIGGKLGGYKGNNVILNKKIDELSAENKNLKAQLDEILANGNAVDATNVELIKKVSELEQERDYWKEQVKKSLVCACKSGGYAADVMRYPRPDNYTEPSLLVNDTINSLRDFHADNCRAIDRQNAEIEELTAERDNLADDLLTATREREVYRRKCGEMADHAHEMLTLVDFDGEVAS